MNTLHSQTVVKMEYFVDADTGLGKNQIVNYDYSLALDTFEIDFDLDASNLSKGHHNLFFRTQDTTGMWSPWVIHEFYIADNSILDSLVEMEYFVDKDLGMDKNNVLNINTIDSITVQIDYNVASLTNGFHMFHFRSRTKSGFWSVNQTHLFYLEDTILPKKLDQMEYFIGKEPRVGNAVDLQISPADSVSVEFDDDLQNLNGGFHFIHLRTKVDLGYWSPWQMQMFYFEDTVNTGTINAMEYFVDKDPHVGKGVALSINAADTIFKAFQFSTQNLSSGRHFLHLRNKVQTGYWSPWQLHIFYVEDTFNSGPINQFEYFIDKDPGVGNAIAVNITPADTFESKFSVDCSNLIPGNHFLFLRNKIQTGFWSPWQMHLFYVKDSLEKSKIFAYSYSIDSSLLSSTDTSFVLINSKSDSLKLNKYLQLDTGLSYGNHYYRIWAHQDNRISSVWHKDTFTVIDCPMLDTAAIFVTGDLCANDTLFFNQNITQFGRWPADSFNFKWFINASTTPFSVDSNAFLSNTGKDSIRLKFIFAKKSDARCKGGLNQIFVVNPVFQFYDSLTVCGASFAIIESDTFFNSGDYQRSFSSSKGCDSTHFLHLTFNQSYAFNDTFNICSGDSIVLHNKVYKVEGNYMDTLNTFVGCDSIFNINIQVHPVYQFLDTFSVCDGDSLLWHGQYIKSSGIHSQTYQTIYGCDSIYSVNLLVNPVYYISDSVYFCEGDSVFKHGRYFSSQSNFISQFQTVLGCDSVYFTTAIQFNKYSLFDTLQLCEDDSIFLHGQYFKSSGDFSIKFSSINACDSNHFVKVLVRPKYFSRDSFEFCSGDSLKVHGRWFKNQGDFTIFFNSVNGCDSVFETHIIHKPTYSKVLNVGLCGGDSFFFDNLYRKVTGVYKANFTSIFTCDSSITLNLTIDSVINTDAFPEICQGDSLLLNGIYVKEAGNYLERFTAAKGCDSIVHNCLLVNYWDSTMLNAAFCFGESYSFFNQTLTQSGIYTHVLKNTKGCDSILFLNLNEKPKNVHSVSQLICHNDSVFFASKFHKGTVLLFDTLKGFDNCDSFVIYQQSEMNLDTTHLTFNLCEGDSVFAGNTFKSKQGLYFDTLRSSKFCDSICITKINVISKSFINYVDTICFNDNYLFYGATLDASGTFQHLLTNYLGCDSVITLNLFKRKQFVPKVISINFATLSADTIYRSYQWYLNRNQINNETNRSINVSQQGVYDISVVNFKGCRANSWDDLLSVESVVLNAIQVYPNPSNGNFNIDLNSQAHLKIFNALGQMVGEKDLEIGSNLLNFNELSEGTYFIYIQTNHSYFYSKVIILK
jgi:hypothetical protein